MGREILKWIALVTMTIDHIGSVLFPEYVLMRIIGRIAFPLYGYLLALGIGSTRNKGKYLARLFVSALISQAPFFLAMSHQPFEVLNIFFTLTLGLISLVKPLLILPSLLISESLRFDYGAYGIALIAGLYLLSKDTKYGIICLLLLSPFAFLLWDIQVFSLLALPIILFYQGGHMRVEKRVKIDMPYPVWRQYFFYAYYPLHLSLLFLIKTFV